MAVAFQKLEKVRKTDPSLEPPEKKVLPAPSL
jgi:hypothetical protein